MPRREHVPLEQEMTKEAEVGLGVPEAGGAAAVGTTIVSDNIGEKRALTFVKEKGADDLAIIARRLLRIPAKTSGDADRLQVQGIEDLLLEARDRRLLSELASARTDLGGLRTFEHITELLKTVDEQNFFDAGYPAEQLQLWHHQRLQAAMLTGRVYTGYSKVFMRLRLSVRFSAVCGISTNIN